MSFSVRQVPQDLVYALRGLRRSPGFATVAIVSLGLGIAANTTVFSIINAVLLGELPVREPSRLVTMVRDGSFTLSYPEYLDARDSGVFEGVSARFPLVPASLGGDNKPERIWGQAVTANFFDVIGAGMTQGRGFLQSEDEVHNRDAVVVLSHGLWKRRFGGDVSLVGRDVILSGRKFLVVGVCQPGFRGTDRMLVPEFWIPLRISSVFLPDMKDQARFEKRDHSWLMVEARLKPGVWRQQAISVLQAMAARLDTQQRRERPRQIMLDPAGKWPGQAGLVLRMLMAGLMVTVGLVLAIACANVANILLARATSRQRELSVRLAIGASRAQILQQLLTESVLLSVIGAMFGFLLAIGASGLLSQVRLPIPLPVEFDFTPDHRVLAFTAALAVATGILFGLLPALRATRADLIAGMRAGDVRISGTRRMGLRNGLVVVQVSLSLVLLAAASLFLRSLHNASRIDLGLQPANILTLSFDPHQHSGSTDAKRVFLRQLRDRVEALANVETTAIVDVLPLSIGGSSSTTTPDHSDKIQLSPNYFQVSDGYFRAMGIPLLQGRDFQDAERAGTAVIDEVVARKFFAGMEPIGRTIRRGRGSYTVIGVARVSKARTIGEDARGVVYRNLDQTVDEVQAIVGVTLIAKTRGEPGALEQAIRAEILTLDPNLAVFNVDTMQKHVEKAFLLPRVAAQMFGVFGGVGLLLAAIGLFGVLSFAVRQRTREIGIRMALGAGRGNVVRMVASEGLGLVAAGLLIGLPLALGFAKLASSLFYGLSASDWVTFTIVPVTMLLTAVLACWFPSRRASRVDPMVALRHE